MKILKREEDLDEREDLSLFLGKLSIYFDQMPNGINGDCVSVIYYSNVGNIH